jgi:hypothetical protein
MNGPHANARLAAAAAIIALGGGCQNPSATLVGAGNAPLPDLADAPAPLGRDGGPAKLGPEEGAPVDAGVRTTSLDRTGWPRTSVRQPRGQVEVQPTYYALFEGFSGDPRASGRFPSAADALAIHGEGPSAPADGAAQPAIGIFWLAAMPFHAVLVPPNTVRREPAGSVEWLPAPQAAAGSR